MSKIVEPYIKNLQELKDDLPILAKEALREHYSEVVMLVKSEQLGKGLNSHGLPLAWSDDGKSGTGRYAKSTQGIYDYETQGFMGQKVQKPAGKPYNFFWTGETLDNTQMKIFPNRQEFEIFTIKGKQSFLESIYGEIFKLTEEHNKYVNEQIIIPYLNNYILNHLFNV